MKRLYILLLLSFVFAVQPYAQKKKSVRQKVRTTKISSKKTTKRKRTANYSNVSIKSLQNQRQQIQREIRLQEQRLKSNQHDVKERLQNLMIINSEIEERQRSIDTIQHDIRHIDGNIGQLNSQLKILQAQLKDRKHKYIKSMQYLYRNRSIQDQLMFIFSAKNFAQMYRRLRFVREYATYQRAQGEMVKSKQRQVDQKQTQLTHVKGQKTVVLIKGQQEHRKLQGKQNEQQQVVSTLQNQQKTIQSILDQQKKKDAALNAQIDRLIAQEVARARARAAAEAKARADAEAKRKRAAELAQKKAAAEAAARENARKIAAAKAAEEKAKAEARAAAQRSAAEKAAADAAARRAAADRKAAEREAAAEAKASAREIAAAKKSTEAPMLNSEDRRLSGGFENNRGRLPMPITGSYRIVSHFGQYNVEGLKNVTLDNKGINILGQPGACARSIYNGEVSAVFSFGGTMVVMVRHGDYISVYCNLSSVSVHRGQSVSTRQVLGSVGSDNILQFQLRRETAKINPEAWLGR